MAERRETVTEARPEAQPVELPEVGVHPSAALARTASPASPAETSPASEAPLLAGRYRVIRELGAGANGVTYEAEDTRDGRRVAVKRLDLRKLGEWKGLELFEREAAVLSHLDHPGIPHYVGYHQIEDEGGPAFLIAQELAPGRSLDQWIASGWRAAFTDAAAIATQVLEVLTYLHELRPPVIHRDLKPSNLMRTDDGRLSLVDFGSVRATFDQSMRGGSTVTGTFGYMAPEQLRGVATPASDLYALGATLLHLMTGQSPDRLPQTRLRYDVARLIQAPPAFVAWLARLCEPEPESRFQSAREALATLRAAIAPPVPLSPVPHSSSPPLRPPRPWSTRAVVALWALLTVAGGGIAVVSSPELRDRIYEYFAPATADPSAGTETPRRSQPVGTSFLAHDGGVKELAAGHGDSQPFFTSLGQDGTVKVYGELGAAPGYSEWSDQQPTPAAHPNAVAMAPTVDNGAIVVAAGPHSIDAWEFLISETKFSHAVSTPSTGVDISSGDLVATVDENGNVVLTDLLGNDKDHQTPPDPSGATSPQNGVAFSLEGTALATTDDTLIHFWSISGTSLQACNTAADTVPFIQVVRGPEANEVTTLDQDGEVAFWNLSAGDCNGLRGVSDDTAQSHLVARVPPPGGCTTIAVSDRAIACASGTSVTLFTANTADLLGHIDGPHGSISALAFDATGDNVIMGSSTGYIDVLPMPAGTGAKAP
jgi:serine/threonine protein kinase